MSYRIVSDKELGVVAWIETPCGLKQPLVRWASLRKMREFAEMLLDFHDHMMADSEMIGEKTGDDEAKMTVDDLLRQALGGEKP